MVAMPSLLLEDALVGPPAAASPSSSSSCVTLTSDAEFWSLFEEERALGRGCFGTVLLVRPRAPTASASQATIAAKVVLADDASAAIDEATLLRSLSHPNIVRLHEVYASASTVFVLMAAELGGDLHKRAEAAPGGVLTEAEAILPLSGVLAALHHLHARHQIVHRDVKASNVLLAADGVTAKLGDFGLAARLPQGGRLTTVCGTHDFLAPEMIRTGHGELSGYGSSVDIWAVGLMLHALLLGDNPFERETDIETLQAILAGDYAPPADRQLSFEVRDLLSSLLVTEPAKRATAEDAAGHAWVVGGGSAKQPAPQPAADGRSLFQRMIWPRAIGVY